MSPQGPIETLWKQFDKDAIPSEATKLQRDAMRMAFYIGARSLWELMMVDAAQCEGEANETSMETLKAITANFAAYGESLRRQDELQ
jgi:hypothetical protein